MTKLSNFIETLRQRGLIAQISHEDEIKQINLDSQAGKKISAYVGLDPTAASLHVGNLAALLMLRRAQEAGLVPIVLFGGATGMIGDPTGRTEMRPMNSKEQIAAYIENFKKLVGRYFNPELNNQPIYVNNLDWIGPMSFIDFARDVGTHFTVARLLSAEVNRTRFNEGGLTFMELAYQLLQSFDFYHLNTQHNCLIQFGGDDQWSNILSGADLIRRKSAKQAFAITTPILADKDGKKFGKTAGNAIWLDAQMTAPYEFFQFFRNVDDTLVERLFYVFTFKDVGEIKNIISENHINAQKELLAVLVTTLVHGADAADKALKTSKSLFSGSLEDLSSAPEIQLAQDEISQGVDILNLLIKCSLAPSRGEARKLVQGGGVSYNGQKMSDINYKIKREDFDTDQQGILIRKGKKDFRLIKLI